MSADRTHRELTPTLGAARDLTIWILEDDPVDQRLVTAALANAGQPPPAAMTQTAEDLLALVDAAERPPDLVLVDLNTPGGGGIHLVKELRARTDFATVPIVVLTSSVNHRDQIDAVRAGVNAFHVKPFDWRAFNELIALVVAYWSLDGTEAARGHARR
ncbi:MAG: response regulator [Acidimicrobiales bacterium]